MVLVLGAVTMAVAGCGSEGTEPAGQTLAPAAPASSTTTTIGEASRRAVPESTTTSIVDGATTATSAPPVTQPDIGPADVPVLENINDPTTALGGICWAFTEAILLAAQQRLTVGPGEAEVRQRDDNLRQAVQLLSADRIGELSADLQLFAKDLEASIESFQDAVTASGPGEVAPDIDVAGIQASTGVEAFGEASLNDKACAGVQLLNSLEPR